MKPCFKFILKYKKILVTLKMLSWYFIQSTINKQTTLKWNKKLEGLIAALKVGVKLHDGSFDLPNMYENR